MLVDELNLTLDESSYEKSQPEDLEILTKEFLIGDYELHNVFGIVLDGRLVKNRPTVSPKPLERTNYTYINRNGRSFVIPDDEELMCDRDLWEEFFKWSKINK